MILRDLFRPAESRSLAEGPWRLTDEGLVMAFGGGATVAGVNVTPESALTYAAAYACITVLAQDVAVLPLITYRRLPNGNREEARDLPIFRTLHQEANPEMSAFIFRETMMGSLVSRGEALAEIGISGGGQPSTLWPIHPKRLTRLERQPDRSLLYFFDGSSVGVPSRRILHLRAFGNGDRGLSPIDLHRQGIGLGMAADAAAAALYGSGSVPGGLLKMKGRLKTEAKDRLRADWERLHGGPDKRGRVAVLEDGTEYQAISFTPEAAQFLESRRFQVEEMCRIYRVPPHKVASLERATFSNIEEQGLDYLQTSLAHWLERWEQELDRKVLRLYPGEDLYCEHKVDALLRGNSLARSQAHVQARTGGWLTRNEIRAMENRPPLPGPSGDDPDAPLNSNRTDSTAGKKPVDAGAAAA